MQVERNSLRAIAFGHGRDNTIDLPYLPANVDIRKGDRLITSGIDGVYPTGLAVCTIISIERNPDSPFARITCEPVAGIENYREVLVLAMPNPEAFQKAQAALRESQAQNSGQGQNPAANQTPVQNPTPPAANADH